MSAMPPACRLILGRFVEPRDPEGCNSNRSHRPPYLLRRQQFDSSLLPSTVPAPTKLPPDTETGGGPSRTRTCNPRSRKKLVGRRLRVAIQSLTHGRRQSRGVFPGLSS